MNRNRLEFPEDLFLLERRYERLIVLHCQMMQCVETKDEVAEICQNVFVKTNLCDKFRQAKRRDIIRELILFAYRRGYIEALINHCESLYPQLDLQKYQLVDVFQRSTNREKYQQANEFFLEPDNIQERLVDFLAQLSTEDLRHLVFLLGSDVDMVGYGRYLYPSVNLSSPTEEDLQERVDKLANLSKNKDRLEIERELRRIYAAPTKEEMHKTLKKANISNEDMDFSQLQYELKRLFVRKLVTEFDSVSMVNNILIAYLQL